MIGGQQPVGRDERRRASGNPDRRKPGALEPRLIGVETVCLAEILGRRVLERPHLAVVELAGLDRVEEGDLATQDYWKRCK